MAKHCQIILEKDSALVELGAGEDARVEATVVSVPAEEWVDVFFLDGAERCGRQGRQITGSTHTPAK